MSRKIKIPAPERLRKASFPAASKAGSFTPVEAIGFILGVFLLFLAAALFSSLVRAVVWRLDVKHNHAEGRARVEKTEIVRRHNSYAVEVTYHLEKDGVNYRRVSALEPEDQTTPTLEESEARRAKYEPGKLYPCWYRPSDPGNTTVLLPDGLSFTYPLNRWWVPVLFGLPGWLLCRWLWRRRKSRDR